MPELPDLTVYVERLDALVRGEPLEEIRIRHPFVLRSLDPPPSTLHGLRVETVERLGKRIVIGMAGDLFVVLHLMIAGRLRWRARETRALAGKLVLAEFAFPRGTLSLTEAGSSRRASLHVVRGREGLAVFDRGGLEALSATREAFVARLRSENHTLKRALTDPRICSGIGNAYSDEILHRARLSPLLLTSRADDAQLAALFDATRATLREWTDRLRRETGDGFPEKVTAFRDGMAVHGRFRLPCPACGAPVQRIRYADNETNYCARCQTGGRLLADRAMSRLLKSDWPRSIDDVD
ncbi:MAG: Fpg/Nei family DNA glycosylase [Gemmatimonadales bacterium]